MGKMLENDVALVTGAAQGIGMAIAAGLAEQGARVGLLDVKLEAAREAADRIRKRSQVARAFECDVADPESCRRALTEVRRELGRVSILVNNAGVLLRGSLEDDRAPEWLRTTMDVNLFGVAYMARACLDDLRATRGCIVNVASIQSFVALSNSFAYNASKGAVLQLTRAMAAELAPHGIRVNGIAPGFIATPMNEQSRARPGFVDDALKRIPLKRLGEPEDLVGAVVFLVSPMSAYVTGATIPVDGGFLAV
jgi:NAD(P)-dependent dehydrogenase (short-subunit alcohol dehydrogenase family)